MRKLLASVSIASLAVVVFVQSAFAAPGDPPVFDASDLSAPINDYATTLLAGLTVVLGVVLVAAAAFTLMKIGVGAIRRWIGRGKATQAI